MKAPSSFQSAFLWSKIKPLGELQILTRASYLLLFFVPVLAGVWNVVAGYYFPNSPMPFSWVLAFFSALFVMLAQTIYQMFAPELIRSFTRRDYVESEVRRYTQHKLPGQLALAEAMLKHVGIRNPPRPQYETAEQMDARNAEKVSEASRYEYDGIDKLVVKARYFAGSLYFVGIGLLSWILILQVIAVLSAAKLFGVQVPE